MDGSAGVWRAVALGIAGVLGVPAIAAAQTTKAGVVTTLQGAATVARAVTPAPAPLKVKDDVFVKDRIVTGESAMVRILLGGKAVVTIRERSALTIHETPTTSTLELSGGKIALAVVKDLMKPGESIRIKTPNAMAGIRGTVIVAEVSPPAENGGAVATRFTLLTGVVDVVHLAAGTGAPAGSPVVLQPLQTISIAGHTPPGPPQTISRAEAASVAADYRVPLPTPPPSRQVTERQLGIAMQHAAALAGLRNGAGAARGGVEAGAGVGGGDVTAEAEVGLGGGGLDVSAGLGVGGLGVSVGLAAGDGGPGLSVAATAGPALVGAPPILGAPPVLSAPPILSAPPLLSTPPAAGGPPILNAPTLPIVDTTKRLLGR
jgi:hypothetical protein